MNTARGARAPTISVKSNGIFAGFRPNSSAMRAITVEVNEQIGFVLVKRRRVRLAVVSLGFSSIEVRKQANRKKAHHQKVGLGVHVLALKAAVENPDDERPGVHDSGKASPSDHEVILSI